MRRLEENQKQSEMTKKARIINRVASLSEAEKESAIAFFSKYPVYENRIDRNSKARRRLNCT